MADESTLEQPRLDREPDHAEASRAEADQRYAEGWEAGTREAEREPRRRHGAAAQQTVGRPRTSLLALLGLVLAVLAVAAVLTGALALIGLVVAVVAALLAIGGLGAARRPNVTGRVAAAIALVIALATIVFGVLVLAGAFGWLDTDTNQVAELRDWLPSWLT